VWIWAKQDSGDGSYCLSPAASALDSEPLWVAVVVDILRRFVSTSRPSDLEEKSSEGRVSQRLSASTGLHL
jgi:hypothetical protein